MAEEVLKCARFGDEQELRTLIQSVDDTERDAFVNFVQPETLNTPLHMACANGHVECVRELLSNGAKHVPNASGNLPLLSEEGLEEHKADCKAIRAQREQAEALKQSKASEDGVIQVEAIDWAQRETWPTSCDDDKFDVLFGSDLVYHQEIVPVLVNVVDGMLAAEGRFVHVASQARHSLVEFKEAMEVRGFTCEVEEVPEDYKTNPLVGNDAAAELFALHFNEMSDVYCIYTFTRTSQP
ncbi:hypothetical protein AM588_10009929 [Phytophthora nicotianae]|uniref:Uncharacterized protein n=1 Tax=Phytophthora nicotianae TaxID=4792 RepID=A0A0W8DK30_PHYNI|nr:hypothetical protein AM588_10009929 [Phytophthora nicotianae]